MPLPRYCRYCGMVLWCRLVFLQSNFLVKILRGCSCRVGADGGTGGPGQGSWRIIREVMAELSQSDAISSYWVEGTKVMWYG